MGKYISLGEYNKLYKYILIYLGISFISLIIFDYRLVFDQFRNEPMNIPLSPFVSLSFNYITFIIVSLILIKIEKIIQKKEKAPISTQEKKLIYNKSDIVTEYGVEEGDYFLYVNLSFVVALDLIEEVLIKINLSLLEYWMFEMFFFEIFNSKILKSKIQKHHIFSLIFILSFCSLIKTIAVIISFINKTNDANIFVDRKWLIPIGIIAPLLTQVFRAFTYCNEKYYLEKRIITIPNYILLYGIIGIFGSSICAIISSFVPCGDNTLSESTKDMCSYNDNEEIYYFDSYRLYFKNFASEFLGLRIFLLIIQSLLYYGSNYYIYVIYKILSPIYHICMKIFNYLILDVLVFINDVINNNIQDIELSINICDILILLFYVLGSVIYLEFIELNFCKLNFYTKRQIKKRSSEEGIIFLEYIKMNEENEE